MGKPAVTQGEPRGGVEPPVASPFEITWSHKDDPESFGDVLPCGNPECRQPSCPTAQAARDARDQVFTMELLEEIIAKGLRARSIIPHPTFDPERLPPGWRPLRDGEAKGENAYAAENRSTGRWQWLVFDPPAPPPTWRERLYGRDDVRAFIVGNRLCATSPDRSFARVGRAAA